MSKKEIDQKRELAHLLYGNGMSAVEIADKVQISRVTLSKWINTLGWREKRAAQSVTRPELVNMLLGQIASLLENAATSTDSKGIDSLSDKLSKLAGVISKLDKKASVVDMMEVFITFGRWMSQRSCFDGDITPELLKQINRYQDLFITENIQ